MFALSYLFIYVFSYLLTYLFTYLLTYEGNPRMTSSLRKINISKNLMKLELRNMLKK